MRSYLSFTSYFTSRRSKNTLGDSVAIISNFSIEIDFMYTRTPLTLAPSFTPKLHTPRPLPSTPNPRSMCHLFMKLDLPPCEICQQLSYLNCTIQHRCVTTTSAHLTRSSQHRYHRRYSIGDWQVATYNIPFSEIASLIGTSGARTPVHNIYRAFSCRQCYATSDQTSMK